MRKVLEANFHQSLFVRGIGHVGTTLSTESAMQGAKTIKITSMETDGVALYVDLENQGIRASAMVPMANIVVLKIERRVEEAESKKPLKG